MSDDPSIWVVPISIRARCRRLVAKTCPMGALTTIEIDTGHVTEVIEAHTAIMDPDFPVTTPVPAQLTAGHAVMFSNQSRSPEARGE